MSGTEYTFKIEKRLVPNNSATNNNSATMHAQYVLTLINNKVNKVPKPEIMSIHLFDAYIRSTALIDLIKIKNNDYRIIFNDDEVRSVLDNFLHLYYVAYGYRQHPMKIEDNVTISFEGKERKPPEYVNQESWLKRIFIWLDRK